MSAGTYYKYEFLRLWRNKRFSFFTVGIPLVLFLAIGLPQRDVDVTFGAAHLKLILVYMVAMAGYGAIGAALGGGARISSERSVGWNRQLRLTPLRVRRYFAAKVLTAYAMALVSIILLFAVGAIFGVHVPASRWAEMIGLILVGLLPFVGIGIIIGHLLTPDSMGPAIGGGGSMFALLGGIWFPFSNGSALQKIGEFIPSYWIAQAARVGVGTDAWTMKGWIVIAGWTVAMAAIAARVYQRDTQRV
jgi:ABC-2 type transport system permease protein